MPRTSEHQKTAKVYSLQDSGDVARRGSEWHNFTGLTASVVGKNPSAIRHCTTHILHSCVCMCPQVRRWPGGGVPGASVPAPAPVPRRRPPRRTVSTSSTTHIRPHRAREDRPQLYRPRILLHGKARGHFYPSAARKVSRVRPMVDINNELHKWTVLSDYGWSEFSSTSVTSDGSGSGSGSGPPQTLTVSAMQISGCWSSGVPRTQ